MRELERILEEMRGIKDGNRKEKLYAKYPPNSKDQKVLNAYSQGYEDGTDNFYNAVVDIIRKHMNDGWISVEERVPKEEGYKVIVCSKQGNIDTGIYSPYTKQWFIGNISALGKDIIAWLPLPEPYHPERSDSHDGE